MGDGLDYQMDIESVSYSAMELPIEMTTGSNTAGIISHVMPISTGSAGYDFNSPISPMSQIQSEMAFDCQATAYSTMSPSSVAQSQYQDYSQMTDDFAAYGTPLEMTSH
jgi:hypothetical protein